MQEGALRHGEGKHQCRAFEDDSRKRSKFSYNRKLRKQCKKRKAIAVQSTGEIGKFYGHWRHRGFWSRELFGGAFRSELGWRRSAARVPPNWVCFVYRTMPIMPSNSSGLPRTASRNTMEKRKQRAAQSVLFIFAKALRGYMPVAPLSRHLTKVLSRCLPSKC